MRILPKPTRGNGSGINYLNKNKRVENEPFKLNFAELKPHDLLKQYLNYVIKNSNNGEYEKQPSKILAELWNISEDKVDRVHKRAVEKGFLVNELKRVYKVDKEKVEGFINE